MSKASDLARLMTSGSTAIHGEAGVTSSGSTGLTTNLQQGLCKAWINYTGISTTASRDSFNISSLTDNATGRTTVTVSNNMNNDDYSGYFYTNAATGTNYYNFLNDYTGGFGGFATSNFSHTAYATADIDSLTNLSGIFGDLA